MLMALAHAGAPVRKLLAPPLDLVGPLGGRTLQKEPARGGVTAAKQAVLPSKPREDRQTDTVMASDLTQTPLMGRILASQEKAARWTLLMEYSWFSERIFRFQAGNNGKSHSAR